jgi:Fungal trichothecene efflux pump (TRI12)
MSRAIFGIIGWLTEVASGDGNARENANAGVVHLSMGVLQRAQEIETVNSAGSDNSSSGRHDFVEKSVDESYVHQKVSRHLLTIDPETDPSRQMNMQLFLSLTAMAFLWVGSQIPLYLFGSVLPRIYSDIGGVDRYVWFVIGYLIPNAALCPFVGALSDMFGRRYVAIFSQLMLIVGPIITATAQTMNNAIGMWICF